MIKDMQAYVKLARGKSVQTPRWLGGKLPISTAVCHELRKVLDRASQNNYEGMSEAEMSVLKPLFGVHQDVSEMPRENELLVEFSRSREGIHAFLFPFEGRLVHEGMAALLSYRLSRLQKATFGLSVNDYGIEILSENKEYPLYELVANHWNELWKEENALLDLAQSIHVGDYSRRHFRENCSSLRTHISRLSGLAKNSPTTSHEFITSL